METATCCKCERPIILLWQSDGRSFNRVERRTLCATCRKQPLALTCAVAGCYGEAVPRQPYRMCVACRKFSLKERKHREAAARWQAQYEIRLQKNKAWRDANLERSRAHNRASYEKHREARIARMRQRRLEHGDAMRAADRERYARKQGKANLEQG